MSSWLNQSLTLSSPVASLAGHDVIGVLCIFKTTVPDQNSSVQNSSVSRFRVARNVFQHSLLVLKNLFSFDCVSFFSIRPRFLSFIDHNFSFLVCLSLSCLQFPHFFLSFCRQGQQLHFFHNKEVVKKRSDKYLLWNFFEWQVFSLGIWAKFQIIGPWFSILSAVLSVSFQSSETF